MLKMKNTLHITILLFVVSCLSHAQIAGKLNKAVSINDTVIIRLLGNVGETEWQKSSDSIHWDIITAEPNGEFTFVADQTTFFRIVTTVEGCAPYISDMGSVSVYGEMSDIDGNVYKTIQIGQQIWMAENLRVTHYPNGMSIYKQTVDNLWWYTDSLAFCWYNNDSVTYANSHGALYNWAAAMKGQTSTADVPSGVQGVCPDGWHLPSDIEWQILEKSLGMSSELASQDGWHGTNEGAKLAGKKHTWDSGVLTSDEQFGESGFIGLPTGDRSWDEGIYYGDGIFGTWWSATLGKSDNVWTRYIQFDQLQIRRRYTYMWNGNSVRCVKD